MSLDYGTSYFINIFQIMWINLAQVLFDFEFEMN